MGTGRQAQCLSGALPRCLVLAYLTPSKGAVTFKGGAWSGRRLPQS